MRRSPMSRGVSSPRYRSINSAPMTTRFPASASSALGPALGEPLFEDPEYCQRHAGTESDGPCVHHDGCSLRELWHALEQWMRRALDRITLADLLREDGRIADLLRTRLTDAITERPLIP